MNYSERVPPASWGQVPRLVVDIAWIGSGLLGIWCRKKFRPRHVGGGDGQRRQRILPDFPRRTIFAQGPRRRRASSPSAPTPPFNHVWVTVKRRDVERGGKCHENTRTNVPEVTYLLLS